MEKSQVQAIAFELIAHAGDAFNHFFTAVNEAEKTNFERAAEEIELGDAALNKAHQSQTSLLVAEANEENIDFSVILVHAQDHLMTTMMYERIAKQMIQMYRKIQERS